MDEKKTRGKEKSVGEAFSGAGFQIPSQYNIEEKCVADMNKNVKQMIPERIKSAELKVYEEGE
jgi:hypothetical protein